jgi:hypothetical protein
MGNDLKAPKLYAVHHPDADRTINSDLTVSERELPGFLEVGVEVGGVRIPFLREKAGHWADETGKLAFLPDKQDESES